MAAVVPGVEPGQGGVVGLWGCIGNSRRERLCDGQPCGCSYRDGGGGDGPDGGGGS